MTAETTTTAKIPQVNEDTIIDGINSLLSMFEVVGQKPFPRNIMTGKYDGSFTVYDIKQMYNAFEHASFKDCRISAYPPVTENSVLIPNLLLLDLDYDDSQVINNGKEYADKIHKTKINKTLKWLQEKFNISNFMVMNTGHGRHIIIPFMFDIPFEKILEFQKFMPYMFSTNKKTANNAVSEYFLTFAKRYLSNNQADEGNYPRFSNVFLRVPGTINTKAKYGTMEIVKIEHEWSLESDTIPAFGDLHPDTDFFYDYMKQLIRVCGTNKMLKLSPSSNIQRKSKGTKRIWIELLSSAIEV